MWEGWNQLLYNKNFSQKAPLEPVQALSGKNLFLKREGFPQRVRAVTIIVLLSQH